MKNSLQEKRHTEEQDRIWSKAIWVAIVIIAIIVVIASWTIFIFSNSRIRINESSEMPEEVSKMESEEEVSKRKVDEEISKKERGEGVSEMKAEEEVSEMEAEEDVPEMETEEDVPEMETEEDVPEMEAEEDVPEMEAEEDVPEMEAEEDVPEMEAEEDVPETEAEEDVPETEAEEDVPEMEAEEDVPETETEENVPEMEAEEDVPEMKVEEQVPEMKVEEEVDAHIISGVNGIFQFPELPTGCEATALTTLMNFWGIKVEKYDLAMNYMPRKGLFYEDDVLYGPNPIDTFVGDPSSDYSFGCYTKCLVRTFENYLNTHSELKDNYTAIDLDIEFSRILQEFVTEDLPVIVIVSPYLRDPYGGFSWKLKDGGIWTWKTGHHAMVVYGYDLEKEEVYVADSAVSSGMATYPVNEIERIYNMKGRYAMTILPKKKQ